MPRPNQYQIRYKIKELGKKKCAKLYVNEVKETLSTFCQESWPWPVPELLGDLMTNRIITANHGGFDSSVAFWFRLMPTFKCISY